MNDTDEAAAPRKDEPGRDPIVLFLRVAACQSRRGRSISSSLMEPASPQMNSRTANTSARLPRRAVVLALLLACKPALAQASASEAEVKAAYLHKFAGFVEWPADASPAPPRPMSSPWPATTPCSRS